MTAVLVIEDDDRIRLALLLALEDEGYDALGAATAEEGLRAQRHHPADYVLVDLMLPASTASSASDNCAVTTTFRSWSSAPGTEPTTSWPLSKPAPTTTSSNPWRSGS